MSLMWSVLVQSISHTLFHLIFKTILWSKYYYYPHFSEKEPEVFEISYLHISQNYLITWLSKTQVFWAPNELHGNFIFLTFPLKSHQFQSSLSFESFFPLLTGKTLAKTTKLSRELSHIPSHNWTREYYYKYVIKYLLAVFSVVFKRDV